MATRSTEFTVPQAQSPEATNSGLIVGVAVGCTVFILLVFAIFFKSGFFRRKNPEDMHDASSVLWRAAEPEAVSAPPTEDEYEESGLFKRKSKKPEEMPEDMPEDMHDASGESFKRKKPEDMHDASDLLPERESMPAAHPTAAELIVRCESIPHEFSQVSPWEDPRFVQEFQPWLYDLPATALRTKAMSVGLLDSGGVTRLEQTEAYRHNEVFICLVRGGELNSFLLFIQTVELMGDMYCARVEGLKQLLPECLLTPASHAAQ